MKIVIGKMKKRLGGMGMPGSSKSSKSSGDEGKDDSLADLFGGGGKSEGADDDAEDAKDGGADEEAEGEGDEGDLSAVSDEDLLKEMKKRGLSPAGMQRGGKMGRTASQPDDESDDM